eukprot:m.74003 g.74003  ORF g.74003 m.74003 type:complete len:573 (-) comp10263_c0_seq4:12-1730(-)
MQRAEGRVLGSGSDFGERKWTGDFTFVQMADTQLGLAENFGMVNGMDVSGWSIEKEMMELAVGHINRLKPAFAIVCGDLVNEFPLDDAQKREAQISDFRSVFSKIDPSIPLVCVCGNHDVGNVPNRKSIEKYTGSFGDDYFAFWCRGVKCIVVNSQLWKNSTAAPDLAAAQARWFSQELASAAKEKAHHTIVFGHVPLFLEAADEADSYFNIAQPLRSQLLDEMVGAGCTHYFCGHYHRNGGGVFEAFSGRRVEVVITAAVGTNIMDRPGNKLVKDGGFGDGVIGPNLSGLRVVKIHKNHIKHKWHTFSDLQHKTPPSPSPTRNGCDRTSRTASGGEAAFIEGRRPRVSSTATTVRRLNSGEWALLKRIRLDALKDSPEAFETSLEDAKKRGKETWVRQADDSATGDVRCTFVAVDERGTPVGIAALYRDYPDGNNPSTAELLQVWVAPRYRGSGGGRVAKRLLDGVLDWAGSVGVTTVQLGVKPGNRRALSFYIRNGFVAVQGKCGDCCSEQRMALGLSGHDVSDRGTPVKDKAFSDCDTSPYSNWPSDVVIAAVLAAAALFLFRALTKVK